MVKGVAEFIGQVFAIGASIVGAIAGIGAWRKTKQLEGNKEFDRIVGEDFGAAISKIASLIEIIDITNNMPDPSRQAQAQDISNKLSEYFSPFTRSLRNVLALEANSEIEDAGDKLVDFCAQALQLNSQTPGIDAQNLIEEADKRLRMLRDHHAYMGDNYQKLKKLKKKRSRTS